MTNPSVRNSTAVSSRHGRSRGQVSRAVEVWVTDRDRRFEEANDLVRGPQLRDQHESVVVDPNQASQEILGFGCALTDAACHLLSKMPAGKRRDFFQEIFDPNGIGLSVCRICIGSSDYAISAYSY